jgi:RNA polymerase sigma-70 factor (ECF subfamily)
MKNNIALILGALTFALTVPVFAEEPSVKSMPPSVVKTIPEAGSANVDPSLTEIRVTFSKDMMTERMWSVCQISKETFPQVGDIHYASDKRTCVVPVKLEPGKTYVLWFNRGQFNSFRDTRNNPSVPYMLVFETRK